jgi:hypothetical protein
MSIKVSRPIQTGSPGRLGDSRGHWLLRGSARTLLSRLSGAHWGRRGLPNPCQSQWGRSKARNIPAYKNIGWNAAIQFERSASSRGRAQRAADEQKNMTQIRTSPLK